MGIRNRNLGPNESLSISPFLSRPFSLRLILPQRRRVSPKPHTHTLSLCCLVAKKVELSCPVVLGLCRRGLAASRDLRRGELVLRVPKSALMTRESYERLETLFRSQGHFLSIPCSGNALLGCSENLQGVRKFSCLAGLL